MMDWFDRLKIAIDTDGRSYAKLACDAQLGRNFVQQLVKNKKVPRGNNLDKLFKTLNISATYIFTGAEMSRETEEFLRRFASLKKEKQEVILSLIRSYSPDDATP